MIIKNINYDKLIYLFKESLKISEGIYFTIDLENKILSSTPHDASKRTCYILELPLGEVLGKFIREKKDPTINLIKIGITGNDIKSLIDIIDKDKDWDMKLSLYENEKIGNEYFVNTDTYAKTVKFYNSTGGYIERRCMHPNIPFVEIPKQNVRGVDIKEYLLNKGEDYHEFELTSKALKKAKSTFFKLEGVTNTTVAFEIKEGNLFLSSATDSENSWKTILIPNLVDDKEIEFNFICEKKHLEYFIDKDVTITLNEERMIVVPKNEYITYIIIRLLN